MDSKYLESIQELELKAGFTLEELKKKKLELVKEYHPDKYYNQPERVKKLAEEKMKKINEAYDYLEKNFNQNSNTTSNSNNRHYNGNQNYEEEYYSKNYGYRREEYYFLSKEEELDYFGELLPRLKKNIEESLREEIQVFIDKIESLEGICRRNIYSSYNIAETLLKIENISNLTEFTSEINDVTRDFMEVLLPAFCFNLFSNNISNINKIKVSDLNYLTNMKNIEIRKINKFIENNGEEINQNLFNRNYKDSKYIEILKVRYYYFILGVVELEKERMDAVAKIDKELNTSINQLRQIPIMGEIIALSQVDKIVYEYLQSFKEIAKKMYETYPDEIFKIIKRIVYIGIEDYEKEAFLSESYYRMHTDPVYGLNFYRKNIKGLKEILNRFPNEKNNILIKFFILLEEKKIEETKKISSEITAIEYNDYFIKIVEILFENFVGKENSFFLNIQLLFSREKKENMLSILKEIPKQLEENIELSFWGKNKENEDFQLLMKKYDFINKNENKSFIEKGNLLVNEILSKYDNLKKVLEENKRLEDLIEVYEYLLSLKENEKIFNFYHINTLLKEEEEVKKEASELSNFFIKSLSTLKSMKEKFLKSKNFLAENISSKEMIKEIEILINEFKPLALRRKKIYEEATGHSAKETLKIVTRAYENMTKFFKELENF